jgi:hypothetical protein
VRRVWVVNGTAWAKNPNVELGIELALQYLNRNTNAALAAYDRPVHRGYFYAITP